jgi:protein phosphatase
MQTVTTITLPQEALVVLAGPAACGKSTFAGRHFAATQVVSSDRLRGLISDDDADQTVSRMAFHLLYELVGMRLALRRLTVVDSTALGAQTRRDLLYMGQRYHMPVVLVLFIADAALCRERDRHRSRRVGLTTIERQLMMLQEAVHRVPHEGFDRVFMVDARHNDQVQVRYEGSPVDRGDVPGPFDIIGDIHGCYDELTTLLGDLGYSPDHRADGVWSHPAGRAAVFLGDLTDRGPASVPVLRLVSAMVQAGCALYTPGNHDNKLLRYLQGRKVRVGHGLEQTVRELNALPPAQRAALVEATVHLIQDAPMYLVLDDWRLVVTHAGIQAWMIVQVSPRIQSFCLYGDVSGETDEQGFPIRRDWARDYRGPAAVVYGHSVTPEPLWVNNTINIDQGCVFGGALSALRWPEREIMQVPAHRVYFTRDTPDLDPTPARAE